VRRKIKNAHLALLPLVYHTIKLHIGSLIQKHLEKGVMAVKKKQEVLFTGIIQ
jgi:hypothetical protein